MAPLHFLILALFFIAVTGQDATAPASPPEADADQSGSPMQSLGTSIESPSSSPVSSPSESPSASPAFSPAEGPASGEAEAPGVDDFDAAAPSPLEDYDDDDVY